MGLSGHLRCDILSLARLKRLRDLVICSDCTADDLHRFIAFLSDNSGIENILLLVNDGEDEDCGMSANTVRDLQELLNENENDTLARCLHVGGASAYYKSGEG